MAVTGWKTPGTVVNIDRGGKTAWANPDNAKASDDAYASQQIPKSDYTDWLRCTNFGFTTGDVPSGAIVVGIEVKLERKAAVAGLNRDSAVYLRDSTGQVGDNKATVTLWPNSDAEETHGAFDDDWNAGLSNGDIRASTFGVDISAENTNAWLGVWAYIDCVSIRVYYSLAPEVTTQAVDNIQATQADGHGTIVAVNNASCDKRGILYGLYVSPTGFNDPTPDWTNEANAYDEDTVSYAAEGIIAGGSWGDWLELTHAAILCDRIRFNAYYYTGLVDIIDVDVHYDGEAAGVWHDVYQGASSPHNTWVVKLFPDGMQTVDKARIRYYNSYGSQVINIPLYEFDFGSIQTAEDANSYGTGAFTKTLTGLTSSTDYYARAYAHNASGYGYGDTVEFTTLSAGVGAFYQQLSPLGFNIYSTGRSR